MRRTTAALLVINSLAMVLPAHADGRGYTAQTVTLQSRRGPNRLTGIVYAPDPARIGRVPAVAMAPGGGSSETGIPWAGVALAKAGYVAIVTGPGSGAPCDPVDRALLSCANWDSVDAIRSGVDYLLTRDDVDPLKIGAAGYSLGSRAAAFAQSVDQRISACVAFDNLARDIEGDRGSPSGSTVASKLGRFGPIAPRTPCLGEASDSVGTTNPTDDDPEIKKTAYAYWRAHRTPTMEMVFLGTGHLTFANHETWSPIFAYYTVAWFDRFLRGDVSAVDRLIARTVGGQERNSLLSLDFRSAIYLPADGIDCEDITAC